MIFHQAWIFGVVSIAFSSRLLRNLISKAPDSRSTEIADSKTAELKTSDIVTTELPVAEKSEFKQSDEKKSWAQRLRKGLFNLAAKFREDFESYWWWAQ